MLRENILAKNIHYYFVVESRNIVGLRVRQARKAAKPMITQKELVARLQVLGIMMDQSGLSKLENEQRPVSDIEVVALAKALRVTPSSLLQENEASHVSKVIGSNEN